MSMSKYLGGGGGLAGFQFGGGEAPKAPYVQVGGPSDPLSSLFGVSKRNRPQWLPKEKAAYLQSDLSGRLQRLQMDLDPLIEDAYRGSYLAQAESMGANRRVAQRQAADAYAAAGLGASSFYGKVAPEQDFEYGRQLSALLGESIAGEAAERGSLLTGIAGALSEDERFYDALGLEELMASKAREAARHAGKTANFLGGLSALGSIAGGAGDFLSGYGAVK